VQPTSHRRGASSGARLSALLTSRSGPSASRAALDARLLAALHVTGAILAVLWVPIAQVHATSAPGVFAAAGIAFVIGLMLIGFASRMPPGVLPATTAFTIFCVIGPAVLFTHTANSPFALFYLWALIYAHAVFSRRDAFALTALAGLTYALVIAVDPHARPVGPEIAGWAMIVGTALMSGWVVRTLSNRWSASEERYRVLFDRNPEAMLVFDPDTLGFLAVNDAAVNRYGYSREEFLAMTLRDIRPPEDVPNLLASMADQHAARLLGDEWRHRRKDGSTLWAQVMAESITYEGREVRLVVAADVTARREAELQLRYAADHDGLTGLPNRHRFERAVTERLADADRRPSFSLVIIDVDHFKFVNDSFGHASGDELIRAIGSCLREAIGSDVFIARLGGDEFALLLAEADAAMAAVVAAHVLQRVRETIHRGSRRITVSAGIAAYDKDRFADAGDLLVAADIALYDAKEAGRNRFALGATPRGGLTWVDEIRAALDEDRVVAYAQPIISLRTREVASHELLARIVDRDGNLIPPAAFIPTAERFGLINDIDRRMAAKAIALAGDGHAVAVNLSAHSIGDRELTRMVAQAVDAGTDPAKLVFEITETAATSHFDQAREFAERLGRIGCGFALDDFGTGFGSFSYLKHVPVGYLKIDMEFVHDIAHDPADQRIVRSIVSIAGALGQKTIAEGVEDAEALELLAGYGVDYAQGYFIGRPAPVSEALAQTVAA
jgi:diguanylate cyclase (GGDEF)-like protein/PAS domain S-box-containing protein